jgi:hypothetical protein
MVDITMTADLLSFAGFGGALIGLVVLGALIFGLATSTEEPSAFSGFLRHKQVKSEDARPTAEDP